MKMNNKNFKWHIRPRVFVMFILLLLVIFLAVFIAFNVFISHYIDDAVKEQLLALTTSFAAHSDENKNHEQSDIPDISAQDKSKVGTNAEVFVLNENYEVVKHSDSMDKNELEQIAKVIENSGSVLDKIDRLYVETKTNDYYISIIRDKKEEHSFFAFFVNVTNIKSLVSTINIVLGIVFAIALMVSFFIANLIAKSITKPVKKLSDFATQIGRGDFTTNDSHFIDTEFNDLNAEMNKSAAKLEAYDAEQRAFFQNVSHELRTPLMSIKCHAEGIECDLMNKEDSSRIIISETNRLSEMVDDLIYISRIETDEILPMQKNDLRETLSFCAESLKHLADKDGKQFIFDFDDTPVLLNYNEKHMTKVFLNLIINALRYALSTITLSCKRVNGDIVVKVVDDGYGISKADLPHIFERFYKGRDGKYGIGLSIVKLVVDLHGGKIFVNSAKLTEFEMIFPS